MTSDRFMSAALAAVAEASVVARRVQSELETVRRITKDDKSPVTVADFAVQAIVAMELLDRLGDTYIVAEEHTRALRMVDQSHVLDAVLDAVKISRPSVTEDDVLTAIDHCDHDGSAEKYWALDPIDGTKGFLRGEQYAIALGRIEIGEVILGVMGCPNLPVDQNARFDRPDSNGAMYAAGRGDGAWEFFGTNASDEPRKIQSSAFRPGGPIRACESVESAHSSQDDTARILSNLGTKGEPARLDSQCKYAVVARGQADIYLRMPTRKGYVEKIWDHAAGMIIAAEAGAVVSDIAGSPLDYTRGRRLEANRGIVCATSDLHPRIIETIEQLRIEASV